MVTVTFILNVPTGSLMHLNEATLLNNVKIRYSKDKIYVSILMFYSVIRTYSNIQCYISIFTVNLGETNS